jgi:hypothetical protein
MVEVGERLEFVGAGLLIVRVSRFEAAPLVSAVTWAIPARAMSVAGMAAVSRVAETKVVGRLLPFHWTTDDPLMNPVPFTVRVKAAPPAVRVVGLRLVSVAAAAWPIVRTAARRRNTRPASTGMLRNPVARKLRLSTRRVFIRSSVANKCSHATPSRGWEVRHSLWRKLLLLFPSRADHSEPMNTVIGRDGWGNRTRPVE